MRPNDSLSGFNLIGNPFPHVIYKGAGGAIDDANLASGYYTLTNEGTWQVHTFEDAILPGQGFLVKATIPTTLTIAKSNTVASSESSAGTRAMSITASGEAGFDRAFVYFNEGTGLKKMKNHFNAAPSIRIQGADGEYAVAHVGSDSRSLELVFNTHRAGEFTLSFSMDDTTFSYLHLIDNKTGTDIDLLQQPSYDFTTSDQEFEIRFTVVFRKR